MSGTAGGGMSGLMSDMLPSPLNFTTPVVPNAPGFGRENREFPRDGKGLGLTFGQSKLERKEGGEKDNEAGGSADLENSDRNEREEGHDDEGPNYGVTDKKRKQGGDDENANGENEREDGGKKQKLN
ncbi:Cyclin-dependent kinase catalytic subunit [Ascosphaera pollenicola]|nr:Cyclin-dependent kinase catalytic subunit [Ascosphaera pollenicola]